MVRNDYELLDKSAAPGNIPNRSLDRIRWVLLRHLEVWICLLALAVFGGISVLVAWLHSEERHLRVLSRELSCTDSHKGLPFYYFMDQTNYYTVEEFQERFSLPEVELFPNNGIKIAHVQLCSRAYRHNWQLSALLDNHREYAKLHGLRYILDAGGGQEKGVWRKIEALLQLVQQELQKELEEQLSWIFYTDIDTLFVNPLVSLSDFLPPDHENPFIMLSKDFHALNFGVFLLRVDPRSVKFLQDILHYPRYKEKLEWAEQSVAIILAEEQQLEERGDLVYLDPPVWNDYRGEKVFTQSLPSFMLHFPSWPTKQAELLPLLDKLRDGKLILDGETLQRCKNKLLGILARFWEQRRLEL